MKTKLLIGTLTMYSLFAIVIFCLTHQDQQATTGLGVLADLLDMPAAGLVALFIYMQEWEPPRDRGATPTIGPILVVGNGSENVSVQVGPTGITVAVGTPKDVGMVDGATRAASMC